MYYTSEKREYVERLSEVMSPMLDFGGIKYANEYRSGEEYIKVWDIIGGALFLDVTGFSLENILNEVAKIVLKRTPESMVTDIEKKRKIAELF